MNTVLSDGGPRPGWFVGASFGGTEDQTPRFLQDGIWENGYDDRYLDQVRAMRAGDRIAIKATYTRKRELPFDNRGLSVSVMAIKATGTITENLNDGKRVRVDWFARENPPREWYFYTYQRTIWRVSPGEWMKDGLLAFAFERRQQDMDRFLNHPYWGERYGTNAGDRRFRWTRFYEAVAEKLLGYRNDRHSLVEGMREIAGRRPLLSYLQERYSDGRTGPIADICPFTAMGTFNRFVTDANRREIAAEMANLLGVEVPVPDSFEGIPFLNNQNSWFYRYAKDRGEGDIDALWEVFAAASRYVGSDQPERRTELAVAYDKATRIRGVAWNLSTGLYWAHPWDFATLDGPSRSYLSDQLRLKLPGAGRQKHPDGESYVRFLDDLKVRFEEESYPVHSFPELSYEADRARGPDDRAQTGNGEVEVTDDEDSIPDIAPPPPPIEPYSIDDVLADGCFLARGEIERLLERLRTRKNLILQGPPGTGKTWIARRLAFALMGEKDERGVRTVQFHPNLSYEDFVRGWRPAGDGKLELADGVFMEAIRKASESPAAKFVVVIEEINRGSPAQIFGELLTLLEAGKRTPGEAIELCYPDPDGTRRPVHVPENLHVIGTMNIADRSLALVDLAFRRRFAFVTLEPKLGEAWRAWAVREGGIDPERVEDIERRINEINERIAGDPSLGKQFRIGHSYVTPTHRIEDGATQDWFRQVAETEIGPLLEEYWFDSPDKAKEAVERLVEGW